MEHGPISYNSRKKQMKRSTFLKTLVKSVAVITVAPVAIAKAVSKKEVPQWMPQKNDFIGCIDPYDSVEHGGYTFHLKKYPLLESEAFDNKYCYVKGIDEEESRRKYGIEVAKKMFKIINK